MTLKSKVQNISTRFSRYVRAWGWIISRNITLYPKLFFSTIFYGAMARLNTIVGFIVSIKSAVWIFQPDTIPRVFFEYVPISLPSMLALFVIIPGLVFLLTGLFRYNHGNCSLKLQTAFSKDAALSISLIDLHLKIGKNFDGKVDKIVSHSDVKKNFAKLFAIEAMILDLQILVLVIFCSLLAGLFISWVIVSTIVVIGVGLISIFVWKRHSKGYLLEEIDSELRRNVVDSTNALMSKELPNNVKDRQNIKASDFKPKLNKLVDDIAKIREVNQKFRYSSDFFMDIGQSIIVFFFLGLLLNADVQSLEVQYLLILALLFRFIISYGKAIVQIILKLSPMYKIVINFKNNIEEHSHVLP